MHLRHPKSYSLSQSQPVALLASRCRLWRQNSGDWTSHAPVMCSQLPSWWGEWPKASSYAVVSGACARTRPGKDCLVVSGAPLQTDS